MAQVGFEPRPCKSQSQHFKTLTLQKYLSHHAIKIKSDAYTCIRLVVLHEFINKIGQLYI